jgi:hypothetical protein
VLKKIALLSRRHLLTSRWSATFRLAFGRKEKLSVLDHAIASRPNGCQTTPLGRESLFAGWTFNKIETKPPLDVLEVSLHRNGKTMEIDTRFPTKLDTVSEAPEPLRSALLQSFPSGEPIPLLVHAPAFTTADEESAATVLAVTNDGWLLVSETENGAAAVEKSNFSETLYLELRSILLLGQLRICFAAVDKSYSATIKFETVEDHFYREAIEMILAGIDPALTGAVENGRSEDSTFEGWPMKIRNEATI